ncbi:hypothetical protein BH23ACT11_BH23ACT11_04310 [soil metagenome]
MNVALTLKRLCRTAICLFVLYAVGFDVQAQFQNKWLSGGSFQNWYSESGSECEQCGFVRQQQDGWRWPGIYRFTDMQAAKSLWIGARNVTDAQGNQWPVRVAHVGPRVSGAGEFFPTRFELVTRLEPTVVMVDGDPSFPDAEMIVERVDPDMEADVMIINEANTLLGVTMRREIMQFSQGYHDNYHIIEYTFTNTGNTNADPNIELPNQTLEGVYFFLQYRMAVAKETRYLIGNPTGWGRNTMIDSRGDGVEDDPPGEQFRAQFSWHGNFPPFTTYDNIGAPILPEAMPALQIAAADTLGRLGSSQFAGVVTLHADASSANPVDDRAQPSTTTWIGSDNPYQANNDAFNPVQMQTEYDVMSSGHRSPRHARAVEPTGMPGYLRPTGDPSLGTSGGFSMANGYGPYTLGPGESVRIVIAEGAAGLSREANMAIGRAFKESGRNVAAQLSYEVHGQTRSMTKNEWVFTGRDSLFQTFNRAIANFESGYSIPRAPAPPATFLVNSGGDRISLEWDAHPGEAPPDRYEIYRARARVDSAYTLIHTATPAERSYDDTTPIRGIDYYYYILAVNAGAGNDGTGLTPPGVPLTSSRYATQTYVAARLQRPAGRAFDDMRVVPNPYNIGASRDIRFDRRDQLAFFNVPGFARIDIYTELGEHVDTIIHDDGSGDAFWDHTTASRQFIASGVYIAVVTVTQDITDSETGEMLFRQGERDIRKFVVIR